MSRKSRRDFLSRTLGGIVAAGASFTVLRPATLLAANSQLAPAPGQSPRGYTAGKFALELDGQFAGWLDSAEGGHATSDVVVEKMSPDHIQHKHIGGVKYEDITVNCGTGMSRAFYEWIKDSYDKRFARKNGAIIAADYNFKQVSRLNWNNGLITEVGFPACDAASKDDAKMTVRIAPEYTRFMTGSQGALPTLAAKQAIQKKWLPANFRLQLDGCPAACSRVNKIEALTVKQKVVENAAGGLRDYTKLSSYLELPDLVITTAEAESAELLQWHEDFVIRGNIQRLKERNGTLEFLAADMREILFTLTFHGLGIFKLTPEKVEAGSENIRRVKAEMYCEDVGFAYGAGTWA